MYNCENQIVIHIEDNDSNAITLDMRAVAMHYDANVDNL